MRDGLSVGMKSATWGFLLDFQRIWCSQARGKALPSASRPSRCARLGVSSRWVSSVPDGADGSAVPAPQAFLP